MDVLSDVLRTLRLSGAVFFTAEFSSPWAFTSPNPELLAAIDVPPAERTSLFHILMDGECVIECDAHPAATMGSGEVVVFPHGGRHVMRSQTDGAPARLDYEIAQSSPDVLPRVSVGGGGRTARFICGYLNCDQTFDPLFHALPTMLLVRRGETCDALEVVDAAGARLATLAAEPGAWLRTTLTFTISEALAQRPGNAAVLGRLIELMFVEIIREYMQQLPQQGQGWLAGLNDSYVGKALLAMHANPARRWTVEALAREVAISRSALAQRFTEVIHEAPMRYLATWRIQLAKQLMRDSDASLQAVATQIGYDSEAAFNRAFKRATGYPPAAWRRTMSSRSWAVDGGDSAPGAVAKP